jgi:hypothetical protein
VERDSEEYLELKRKVLALFPMEGDWEATAEAIEQIIADLRAEREA